RGPGVEVHPGDGDHGPARRRPGARVDGGDLRRGGAHLGEEGVDPTRAVALDGARGGEVVGGGLPGAVRIPGAVHAQAAAEVVPAAAKVGEKSRFPATSKCAMNAS